MFYKQKYQTIIMEDYMEINLGNYNFIGIYKKDINIFFNLFKDNLIFEELCKESIDKILELESQANKIKNEFSQFIQKSRKELENDNKTENLNKIKLSIQNYNKYHFEYLKKLKENDLFKNWEEHFNNINKFLLSLFWENEDPDIYQECINNSYIKFFYFMKKEIRNIDELNSIIVFLIYFQFKYFNEFQNQESFQDLKKHCDIHDEIEEKKLEKINIIISILNSIESAITNQIKHLENSKKQAVKNFSKIVLTKIKCKIKENNQEKNINQLTKNKFFLDKLTEILNPFFSVTFDNGFYEIEKKCKYLPENIINISINELINDINYIFIKISKSRQDTLTSRLNTASDYFSPQIAIAQNYMNNKDLGNIDKGSHMEIYLCNELKKLDFFDVSLKLPRGINTENYYYEIKLKSQKSKLNDIHFFYSSDKEMVNFYIDKFDPIFNNLLQKNLKKLIPKRKQDIQTYHNNINNHKNNSFQNFLNYTISLYKNYFSIKEKNI